MREDRHEAAFAVGNGRQRNAWDRMPEVVVPLLHRRPVQTDIECGIDSRMVDLRPTEVRPESPHADRGARLDLDPEWYR